MEIYKIRNKEGLYWEGHAVDKFTDKGKTWKKKSHANSAVTNAEISKHKYDFMYEGTNIPYQDRDYTQVIPKYLEGCKIVKFELTEVETFNIE